MEKRTHINVNFLDIGTGHYGDSQRQAFLMRGYYVDTVGKNAKKINEYIKNQLREDLEYD